MDTGGCGLFQVFLVLGVYVPFFPIVWTNMFMAFGIYNPGWKCVDSDYGKGESLVWGGNDTRFAITTGSDESCEVFESCHRIEFDRDVSTIVSEWGLLCSSAWIPSFIISMQMVGLLIGAYAGGHLVDKCGRKLVLYGSILLNGCLSAIAAFSVNWQMFTALVFLIGVPTGAAISTVFLFPAEFVPIRWRGILTTAPLWSMCLIAFVALATLLRSWKYILIANGVFSILLCSTAFWIPESMRWLAVNGKFENAVDVANKMARTNRKPKPNITTLELFVKLERKTTSEYSFLDVFRRGLYRRTLITCFTWFTLTIVYNVIGFGVSALSGNFFLNLFLVACIPIMTYPVIPLVIEKLGRKPGIVIFSGICCACCFSVVVTFLFAPMHVQHIFSTVFTVFAYGSIECAWGVVLVFTYELYPTVVRGLGYGCANGTSRFGAILAPFLVPKNYDSLYTSYIVLGTILLVNCFLTLLLPETKGRPLEDIFEKEQVEIQENEDQSNVSNSRC